MIFLKNKNGIFIKASLPANLLVLVIFLLLAVRNIFNRLLPDSNEGAFKIILLQLLIFALPTVLFCYFRGGKSYLATLRLAAPKLKHLLFSLFSALVLISGSILIGIIFGGSESLNESFSLYTSTATEKSSFFAAALAVVAYAVLPAVCEELIFRGIICAEYEKYGVLQASIFSSVLFALLHFNFLHIPVYIFAGCVLTLTLYATRSLLVTVLAHLFYNVFCLFGQPIIAAFYNTTGDTSLLTFAVGFVLILSAAIFCSFAAGFYREYAVKYDSPNFSCAPKGKNEIIDTYKKLLLDPYIIACFVLYIIFAIIDIL